MIPYNEQTELDINTRRRMNNLDKNKYSDNEITDNQLLAIICIIMVLIGMCIGSGLHDAYFHVGKSIEHVKDVP